VRQGINYDLTMHAHMNPSLATVAAAQISGDKLAKAVILEDYDVYAMAVVPATRTIRLGKLRKQMKRDLRLSNK